MCFESQSEGTKQRRLSVQQSSQITRKSIRGFSNLFAKAEHDLASQLTELSKGDRQDAYWMVILYSFKSKIVKFQESKFPSVLLQVVFAAK